MRCVMIAILVLIIVGSMLCTGRWNREINRAGIEANAVVRRVEARISPQAEALFLEV